MSGDEDNASIEACCGDVCVCEESFPNFTFACADGEGYVPRHACDACKGYVWFDDKHSELICNMTIEQYAEFRRKEEATVLEELKHIWDDISEGSSDEGFEEMENMPAVVNKDYSHCLIDSDDEEPDWKEKVEPVVETEPEKTEQ
jgi:hypothetical protein